MAGKQLAALSHQLVNAGWPADTPASVVSRAGWPDARHSDHSVSDLQQAGLLHAGRPTIVTVGAGARALNTPIHRACTAPVETLKPLKCEASPVGETPSSVTSSKQEP